MHIVLNYVIVTIRYFPPWYSMLHDARYGDYYYTTTDNQHIGI